jgi:hypothetical protein
MKKQLFRDIGASPADGSLRKRLGPAFQYYEIMREISGGYLKQWQHTNGNGWLLKVGDTRRALYYLGAFEDGIEISLTVRDAERESLINSPRHARLQTELLAATQYSGGYALRFGIESLEACLSVSQLVEDLIDRRGRPSVSTKKVGRRQRISKGQVGGPVLQEGT